MGRLNGKRALIVGADSPAGRDVARRFAKEGAALALASGGQGESGIPDLVQGIRSLGGMAADVGKAVRWSDWERVLQQTVRLHGGLDIVVYSLPRLAEKGLEHETVADWQQIVHQRLTGLALGLRAAVEKMPQGGSVVSVLTTDALKPQAGSAFAALSGAIRLLSAGSAAANAASGVRFNAVFAGETSASEHWNLPAGRADLGENVANAVLLLASEESSYVNGSEWVIDGGNGVRARRDIVADRSSGSGREEDGQA
ncbi:SDR family NAD(P)-dependent oxidoreductase [Cohnella caldifontis]|uniref:SDR family NAD(P)-dependent oxidoreductase n=1 Tax=Cohnella caldifontis TaxID=3027471 RepID=UPI0023EB37B2|nr:SDR family oxidoreductase [Cohnella sp. YIM B05605]